MEQSYQNLPIVQTLQGITTYVEMLNVSSQQVHEGMCVTECTTEDLETTMRKYGPFILGTIPPETLTRNFIRDPTFKRYPNVRELFSDPYDIMQVPPIIVRDWIEEWGDKPLFLHDGNTRGSVAVHLGVSVRGYVPERLIEKIQGFVRDTN